jgi:hypothetical protein
MAKEKLSALIGVAVGPSQIMKDEVVPVADPTAAPESVQALERDIAIGLARAEAEVSSAESVLAMFESRVRAISSTLARLRALTLQVGIRRPEPITQPTEPSPIDEVTAARARRMLARGGFVRIS